MIIDTLVAKFVADTSGFKAALQGAGLEIQRVEKHAAGSTRGLSLLRGGLQSLAFQATGVSGPIGKITTGLLTLGAGSAAVIGVVAGMALIAGAWKLATAEINKYNKATEDAIALGHSLLNSAHDAAVAQRAQISGQLTDARAALGRALNPPRQVAKGGSFPGVVDETEVTRLNTQISQLTFNLGLAQRNVDRATESLRNQNKVAKDTADSFRELAAEVKKYSQLLKETLQAAALQAIVGGPATIAPFGFPSAGFTGKVPSITKSPDELTKALIDLDTALADTADAAQLTAARMIQAFAGLAATLVSGGSAGGFLAGLGGIIGVVNPIAGAIVGGLGSILLASESNEERRHQELLAALEPVGETLFLLANTSDPDSIDSFVRRSEQATGRRVTVRFGGR